MTHSLALKLHGNVSVRISAAPQTLCDVPVGVYGMNDNHKALVDRALDHDAPSLTALVKRLTPVIQARVARRLVAHSGSTDLRKDVEDYSQDVFLYLFEKEGQALRAWDPERGSSLENFVGLIAERRTVSGLRSGKRNPWREREGLENVDEPVAESASVERHAADVDELDVLLLKLRERVSDQGWDIFELLYIQECSVDDIQRRTGLSRDAIYAWRSRLRKLARELKPHDAPTSLDAHRERVKNTVSTSRTTS